MLIFFAETFSEVSNSWWLDVFCVSEIISNVILSENYKYWFLSFGFYIYWKNIKWRLSIYIWLKLKFSIIEENVRIRLVFLSK